MSQWVNLKIKTLKAPQNDKQMTVQIHMCSFVRYIFYMYNNLNFTVNGQPLARELVN